MYPRIFRSEDNIFISDHFDGFSPDFKNWFLTSLGSENLVVRTEYHFDDRVKDQYKNFNFVFDPYMWETGNQVTQLYLSPKDDSEKSLSNFICSFNGSGCTTRKLLVSALHKFKWFDTNYCSKNFNTNYDNLDGLVKSLIGDCDDAVIGKFILSKNLPDEILTHNYSKFNHSSNVMLLKPLIKDSFVQIVGETTGINYYPFVTEKMLYPILCKTFYLGFAQPGWHSHIEKYFGFKQYNKVFDYKFDEISNPLLRLIALMEMISKFEKLSKFDWHDLYLVEQDTIDFNYDHFISKEYTKNMVSYNLPTPLPSLTWEDFKY